MQAVFRQEGGTVDYTPGANVAAGQVVVQDISCRVARTLIEANRLGSLATRGLFRVVKATGAINAGAAVYWDADGNPVGGVAGTGAATTTSGGNTYLGRAAAAAGANDTAVDVVLSDAPAITNTIHQDLTNVIADPGNGQAIPVTDSGSVSIVTAGAETRTLAAPTDVGQVLSIHMKTDGGDCVITCATGVNQTGNNTITLNDAGDTVVLVGIALGANKRWRVVVNDGATLSTV